MITRQHPFFPAFLQLMREAAATKPVYDLGTSRRFAKEIGLVREEFLQDAYFAGGYSPDRTLDDACDFHCDVQNLREIADGSVGCVLSMSVLEHVEDPWRAVSEFHRVLRPGGMCIVSVPFLLSYHGKRGTPANPVFDARKGAAPSDNSHDGYGDYWRFTHEGLTRLFVETGFSRVDVWPIDGWLISRLQVVGVYEPLARWRPFRALITKLDRPRLGRATTFHFARARKG